MALPRSRQTTDEFKSLYLELRREIDSVLGSETVDDGSPVHIPNPVGLPQPARRTAVRAVGAFVEAVSFSLKQLAIRLSFMQRLSRAEVALCLEEGYDLDEKGEPIVRSARLRTLSNVRFAFAVVARVSGCPFTLDVSGEGWSKLRSSLLVRDRLMHPKSAVALIVGDDEIIDAVRAYLWFDSQGLALVQDVGKQLAETVVAILGSVEHGDEAASRDDAK